MSWSFSLALVEEFKRQGCLVTESYARLKEIRTVEKSSWLDRKTGQSRPSPSGTTPEPLTVSLGVAPLMSCLVGSRVSPSALQGNAEGPRTTETCGPIPSESYARYDRDSSSWKMSPDLFDSTSPVSWETWPSSGSMRSGECWERATLALRTNGSGSGSWLATPTAKQNQKHRGCRNMLSRPMLPTPSAVTYGTCHNIHGRPRPSLETMAKHGLWPTPTANEDAAGTPGGKMQPMLGNHPEVRGTTPEEWSRGTLNPLWVEWLMGWPIGWTGLEPLGTDKSHSATQQPGGISKGEEPHEGA